MAPAEGRSSAEKCSVPLFKLQRITAIVFPSLRDLVSTVTDLFSVTPYQTLNLSTFKPYNNIYGKCCYFCHVIDETVEAHSGQVTSLESRSQEWAERGTELTWQPACRVQAQCPGSPEGSEAEMKTRLALKPMAIPAQTVSLPHVATILYPQRETEETMWAVV